MEKKSGGKVQRLNTSSGETSTEWAIECDEKGGEGERKLRPWEDHLIYIYIAFNASRKNGKPGGASKVQSLFRLSRRKKKASSELTANSPLQVGAEEDPKGGRRVATERQAIVVRANNGILPSGICSSASEISTGKTASSCALRNLTAIVDHNKDVPVYRDMSQNIWEGASRVDANKNF